jgi:hypothetical protein
MLMSEEDDGHGTNTKRFDILLDMDLSGEGTGVPGVPLIQDDSLIGFFGHGCML